MSDDIIACDLRFPPQPIKNPGYAYDEPNVLPVNEIIGGRSY